MTSLFSDRKPSLTPSSSAGALPPRPKPFHMTDPFMDRGLWCFWLTADHPVLRFVSHLQCVLQQPMFNSPFPFRQQQQARMLFSINPRYDHQEVWLWIYETLECETKTVELGDLWVDAIEGIDENASADCGDSE